MFRTYYAPVAATPRVFRHADDFVVFGSDLWCGARRTTTSEKSRKWLKLNKKEANVDL